MVCAAAVVSTQDCGFSTRLGDGTGQTCVSSVEGLDVLGTTYDVSFEVDQFTTVFGDPDGVLTRTPTFWGDFSGATAAAVALASLFNALTGISGTTDGSDWLSWALVPIGCTEGGCTVEEANNIGGDVWELTPGPIGTTTSLTEPWAVFTPVVVPIPAAAWLFGSALGIFGWMRRKVS